MTEPATGAYPLEGDPDSIAIIGVSCRFPGADTVEEFWGNLRDGVESISPVSFQEILDTGLDAEAARDPRRVRVTSALSGIEFFDAGFFDFSPRQAQLTDPQQRFFLECAWESLENAGYDPATCGQATGVFAGSSISTYLLFNLYPELISAGAANILQIQIGNDKDYLATQLAYRLNLKGPAVNVQTACSTSLVAVHLACQSLLNHECDLALAGGVTVRVPARAGYVYQAGSILSPDGHCRSFDADAQGTVFGSGVGIVVLKRLADALADGDAIDAVIKGSAVNNDGSSKAGYTAPGEEGQAKVVAEALAVTGVDARTIQYVEMHGTGTPLGDPIEVAALAQAFRARAGGPLAPRTCAIGAVKSNFGHLESAAGIAGLIKTVLALKHRQIPPSLHFTRPNPAIDFSQTPFYVNTRLSGWEVADTPRRAGVSSFGIGGTNAHVVIEQAPGGMAGDAAPCEPEAGRPYLLPLSARHPAALAALARAYQGFLDGKGPGISASVRDICWSASLRRKHHPHRVAVAGRTHAELATRLAELSQEHMAASETAAAGRPGRLVFVFSGHGSQWTGMGRQLLEHEPVFRAALEQCDQLMQRHSGRSVIAELTRPAEDGSLPGRADMQLPLFAIQVGLMALWRSWGVEPDAVIGHSMGEIAAAHSAGVLSLEDAVRVICHRSRLIDRVLGQGKMLAAALTLEQAREILAGREEQVSIAISNSPTSTVLSGDPDALTEIAADLRSRGTFHRWVTIGFASHSPQMDPLLGELRQALKEIVPRKAAITIASTVTGTDSDGTGMGADYWARNLREPVQFATATRWLSEHDFDIFVEVSPHPVLRASIEDTLYHLGRPGTVVSSLRRHADQQRCLLEALGELYRAGQRVEWDRLYPRGGRYVRLPGYPWQRQRYWIDPPARPLAAAVAGTRAAHPLLGRRLRSPLSISQFESTVSPATATYLDDHRVGGQVVFPATGYLEMFWQAAEYARGAPYSVTDVVLHEPLDFPDNRGRVVQTIVTPGGRGGAGLEILSWDDATSTWRSHATARAGAAQAGEVVRSDLGAIRDRCRHEITPGDFYQQARDAGVEYGPYFRGIESLRLGEGEAIGEIRLPDEQPASPVDDYAVHPALLDACLQLTGSILAGNARFDPSVPDNGAVHDDHEYVHLPSGIAAFRVLRSPRGRIIAHARLHDDQDQKQRSGDIVLYDEQGDPVAEVLGLALKRVDRAALRAMLHGDVNDWLHEVRWRRQPQSSTSSRRDESAAAAPGRRGWLILADHRGVGQALARQLEQRGEAATLVFARHRPDTGAGAEGIVVSRPGQAAGLLDQDSHPISDVVYLWGLDAAPMEQATAASLAGDESLICGGALPLAQALARRDGAAAPRLWLVTQGAQDLEAGSTPLAPAQAPLWGLGRTLRIEHPDLDCRCVDLDAADAEESARTLLGEAVAADHEEQVAFRDSERFVARLVRVSRSAGGLASQVPGQSLQLTIPARGAIDNLAIVPAPRRAPGAGEVEIRIRATGLNFRDVLNTLGGYPGDPGPLGLECAGEITSVGAEVSEFEVGDEVVAMAPGSFATFVNVPAIFTARKPSTLTFAEAATVPIAFMTAYYGLCHVAQLSQDDSILIHSAAGGLGLAAVQLARRAGAEIFGTAGTPDKRDYLRSLGLQHVMPSRTLEFADELMKQTGGQGVSIVLNSLNGEYIPRNLSVLAADGRFVEVGKNGIWAADRVREARPDASYFVVDLDQVAQRDPVLIGGMLRKLMDEFEQGALTPLPRRVFPSDAVTRAFRYMADAKHIGKVVVSQEVGLSSLAPDRFSDRASYLISGGLGVLGLRAARWMADHGARHLALLGRGAPSSAAQAVIDDLTRGGIQVLVISADVSREDHVLRALQAIGAAMPPLRGVIHAAGIADDGILLRQSWERFSRVLAPKVQGTWNLHEQTRRHTLDFFVFFSSINALLGNAGQSSYAAANAFLDALACARRAQGLPALSINWWGWSETGLAVGGEVTAWMSRHGMGPGDGLRVLEQAMRQQKPQVAVLPANWAADQPAGRSSLLADLRTGRRQPDAPRPASAQPDLKERLAAAVPRNRRACLAAFLSEQARLTLGLDQSEPLDRRRPLNEMGLDSLMAIGMRGKLSSALGQILPATLLFNYPTIEALSEYLADEVLGLPPAGQRMESGRASDSAAGAAQETGSDAGTAGVMRPEEVPASLAAEVAAMRDLLDASES